MKNLNKRESLMLVMIVIMTVGLLIMAFYLNDVQKEKNKLEFENYNLKESNCELNTTCENLQLALKREHKIALSHDTKLLVANLAWIDSENGTFYMNAFVGMTPDGKESFEELKGLFDKDKQARARAVAIVEHHLDDLHIYSITDEYYDYLVSDEYTNDVRIDENAEENVEP